MYILTVEQQLSALFQKKAKNVNIVITLFS